MQSEYILSGEGQADVQSRKTWTIRSQSLAGVQKTLCIRSERDGEQKWSRCLVRGESGSGRGSGGPREGFIEGTTGRHQLTLRLRAQESHWPLALTRTNNMYRVIAVLCPHTSSRLASPRLISTSQPPPFLTAPPWLGQPPSLIVGPCVVVVMTIS